MKTRHIQKRMNQRGIQQDIIDAVKDFGFIFGDKIILGKKNCIQLSKECDRMMKLFDRITENEECVVLHDCRNNAAASAAGSYACFSR